MKSFKDFLTEQNINEASGKVNFKSVKDELAELSFLIKRKKQLSKEFGARASEDKEKVNNGLRSLGQEIADKLVKNNSDLPGISAVQELANDGYFLFLSKPSMAGIKRGIQGAVDREA